MAHLIQGLVDETFDFQREDYILHAKECDLIPSSIQLSGIEPSLANAMSREFLLKTLLDPITDEYDYVEMANLSETVPSQFPNVQALSEVILSPRSQPELTPIAQPTKTDNPTTANDGIPDDSQAVMSITIAAS